MADTMQIVSWALEKKCAYRDGKDWEQPSRTHEQLADLTALAGAVADNRVIALVGRWKKEYPGDTHVCRVCGFDFVPNDTHRQEQMDHDRESDSLERQLGADKFPDFVRRFILSRGVSEKVAEAAWEDELEHRKRRKRIQAGEAPASVNASGPPCPACGKPLRTDKAKQCFGCGADWH